MQSGFFYTPIYVHNVDIIPPFKKNVQKKEKQKAKKSEADMIKVLSELVKCCKKKNEYVVNVHQISRIKVTQLLYLFRSLRSEVLKT